MTPDKEPAVIDLKKLWPEYFEALKNGGIEDDFGPVDKTLIPSEPGETEEKSNQP